MNDMLITAPVVSSQTLAERYVAVRRWTEQLASSLSDEDQCVQSMPDASPAKWHRAHITWFFEQFMLTAFLPGYQVFDDKFRYLFNSYYEAVGPRHPRPNRGLLTRPSATRSPTIARTSMPRCCACWTSLPHEAAGLVELGLQHEQQHQELLLTDILHAFAQNPTGPAVLPDWREPRPPSAPTRFVDCRRWNGPHRPSWRRLLLRQRDAGAFGLSATVSARVAPRAQQRVAGVHRRRRIPHAQRCGCPTDGRVRRPPDGPRRCIGARPTANGGRWACAALCRSIRMRPCATSVGTRRMPIARWADARLPTESEWEAAAGSPGIDEMTGHVWQWTGSAYSPYPGYRPVAGAVGEYNGKFMINQMVLRGASLATPAGHTRPQLS